MKKTLALLTTLALLLAVLPVSLLAAGEQFDLYFTFDKEYYEIGEMVTAQMCLDRTDSDADYAMYAFESGVMFNTTYLEYSGYSECAPKMRVSDKSEYYSGKYYRVDARFHGLGKPVTRSSKLVVAVLQFKALSNIRADKLYFMSSSVYTGPSDLVTPETVNGVYTIGNPAAPTFAVTFASGAQGTTGSAPTVEDKAEGDLFLLPACGLTYTGYTFAGWSDGQHTLDAGTEYTMPGAAVAFTAQWIKDPVQRAITFTAGTLAAGTTAGGEGPAPRALFPGETLALPTQNTLVLAGYSFEGWSLGETVYQPGDVYTVPDGDVTFAAVWKSIDTGEQTGGGGSVVLDPQPTDTPWVNPFTDVRETDWFYPYVEGVSRGGLMDGMKPGVFAPYTNMSRAMLVTVLHRIAGKPAVTAENRFADVPDGVWYTEPVVWAAANGVVDGYRAPTATEKGLFGPLDNVTRQQMVAMIWRWRGKPAPTGGTDLSTRFSDWGSVASWAKDAMTWAVETGLVDGMTETTIAPTATANRAQCAAVLTRLLP